MEPPTSVVNTDGAVNLTSKKAGCGGVLRHYNGVWIVGFSEILGQCNPFEAEEWAVMKSLQLAWDMGFKNIIVESDSKTLVESINDYPKPQARGSLVLLEIKNLLKFSWNVVVNFVPREQNMVADSLAKAEISNSSLFDSVPLFLRDLLLKDCMGFKSPDLV